MKVRFMTCLAFTASAVFVGACGSALTQHAESWSVPTLTGQAGALDLKLCSTRVSNSPAHANGVVNRRSATACVNGVDVLVAPAPGACLTSGFGPRRGRAHRGIDYQSQPAGPVVAAADGVVLESAYRAQDFGHWVVIDHGSDVYTAYAHLKGPARGITPGRRIRQGQQLGVMGESGASARGIHLHYEVRQGSLPDSAAGSQIFTLKALDPFALPASCRNRT